MKFLKFFSFFLIAFISSQNVIAQTQYTVDYEILCWDSAGTTITLLHRAYEVQGVGQVAEYRLPVTLQKVVPTVGTVGACSGETATFANVSTVFAHAEGTTTVSVPINAKEVWIYNAGGLAPTTGTVNGAAWSVGRKEYYHERQVGNDILQLPAYSITCNGSLFEVTWRL